MLNGLDLFSGIGGLTLALAPWVRPVAYCENDRYAQSVLLSRIGRAELPWAPIWDDVRTLRGSFSKPVDIIYGGFPCQDISVAGLGAGLAGKRSGLVSEIFRIVDEFTPAFVFLENVPAIRTRGAESVTKELAGRGFDCRWLTLSAAEVGATHRRERWFLMAYSERNGLEGSEHSKTGEREAEMRRRLTDEGSPIVANTARERREQGDSISGGSATRARETEKWRGSLFGGGWWEVEPDVGRVAHGVPARVDRLRGLGNAVVPLQAREAFKRLMGL